MNNSEPIIVAPVEHSRSTEKRKTAESKYFTYTDTVGQTSYTAHTTTHSRPGSSTPHAIPQQPPAQSKSRLSGVAQIVGGGACTLIGIPLLILPGPGLLAVGGGLALMARGAKTLIAPRTVS